MGEGIFSIYTNFPHVLHYSIHYNICVIYYICIIYVLYIPTLLLLLIYYIIAYII